MPALALDMNTRAMTASIGGPIRTVPCRSQYARLSLRQDTRCMAQATAKKAIHKTPSSATAATELEALSQWSTIIPDTVLMQKVEELELQAATVSSSVLAGMMGNPQVPREYQARFSMRDTAVSIRQNPDHSCAVWWYCRWP